MAQIVAATLVSHGPLVTGRPEVSKPEHYHLGANPYLIRRVFRARFRI